MLSTLCLCESLFNSDSDSCLNKVANVCANRKVEALFLPSPSQYSQSINHTHALNTLLIPYQIDISQETHFQQNSQIMCTNTQATPKDCADALRREQPPPPFVSSTLG
jgi:hypothetical protein